MIGSLSDRSGAAWTNHAAQSMMLAKELLLLHTIGHSQVGTTPAAGGVQEDSCCSKQIDQGGRPNPLWDWEVQLAFGRYPAFSRYSCRICRRGLSRRKPAFPRISGRSASCPASSWCPSPVALPAVDAELNGEERAHGIRRHKHSHSITVSFRAPAINPGSDLVRFELVWSQALLFRLP